MHLSPITNRKYKTSNHTKLFFQLCPPMNHYHGSISLFPKSRLLTQTNKTRLTEDTKTQNSSFNVSTVHKANNPTPPALPEQTHVPKYQILHFHTNFL